MIKELNIIESGDFKILNEIKSKFRSLFKSFENRSIDIQFKTIKLYRIYNKIKTLNRIRKWAKNGLIGPPPQAFRYKIIKLFAKKFSIDIFIETGTYLGNTIDAVKKVFKKIYSIELNSNLFTKAKERFSKYNYIRIILGDSSEELPKLLTQINKTCLFWLDAHYSGGTTSKGDLDTPIKKEIQSILNHQIQDHVILIDDAHDFNGEIDYPSIEELRNMINKEFPKKVIKVKENIIRIHKRL